MMKKPLKKVFIKSTALTLALLFPINIGSGLPLAHAQEVPSGTLLQSLDLIPAQFGSLKDYAPAEPGKPFVIHIQDAHANPDAQQKIRQILEWLYEKRQNHSMLVGLEAAAGEIHPEYFDFSEVYPEVSEAVISDLHKKGEITGAEMFAWDLYKKEKKTSDKILFTGIETADIYRENLKSYRDMLFHQNEVEKSFEPFLKELEVAKSRIFSPQLRAFLKEKERRKNGDFGSVNETRGTAMLDVYVNYLAKQLKETLAIDLRDPIEQIRYPHYTRILAVGEMQKKIDTASAKKQTERLLHDLKPKLFSAEDKDLYLKISSLETVRSPRAALESLFEFSGKYRMDLKSYPEFLKYAGRLILQSEIDSLELFNEIENLEALLISRLAKTEKEKELVSIADAADFSKRLAFLELTRTEYARFKNQPDQYRPKMLVSRLAALTKTAASSFEARHFEEAIRFYETAEARDRVLLQNFLSAGVLEDSLNVVITGGFHTEGLKAQMIQRGLGYAVIQPKITEIPEKDMQKDVFTDKNADLSRYFQTNPLDEQQSLFLKQILETALPYLSEKYPQSYGKLSGIAADMINRHPVLPDSIKANAQEGESVSSLELQLQPSESAADTSQKVQAVGKTLPSTGRGAFERLFPGRNRSLSLNRTASAPSAVRLNLKPAGLSVSVSSPAKGVSAKEERAENRSVNSQPASRGSVQEIQQRLKAGNYILDQKNNHIASAYWNRVLMRFGRGTSSLTDQDILMRLAQDAQLLLNNGFEDYTITVTQGYYIGDHWVNPSYEVEGRNEMRVDRRTFIQGSAAAAAGAALAPLELFAQGRRPAAPADRRVKHTPSPEAVRVISAAASRVGDKYMLPGVGLNADTGAPRDHIIVNQSGEIVKAGDYGAPSKDGVSFPSWLQILNPSTGPFLKPVTRSRTATLKDLISSLESLRAFQRKEGSQVYGGLFPWHTYTPGGRRITEYDGRFMIPTLDNSQTTVGGLLPLIGSFWDAKKGTQEALVRDLALEILTNQDYGKYVDAKGKLVQEYIFPQSGGKGRFLYKDGHDLLSTEWAIGHLFAFLTKKITEDSWKSLDHTTYVWDSPAGPLDMLQFFLYSGHEAWILQYFAPQIAKSRLYPLYLNFAYAHDLHARENNMAGFAATEYRRPDIYVPSGPTSKGLLLKDHPVNLTPTLATPYATALVSLIHPPSIEWLSYLLQQPRMLNPYGFSTGFDRNGGESGVMTADNTLSTFNSLGELDAFLANRPGPVNAGILRALQKVYNVSETDVIRAFDLHADAILEELDRNPERKALLRTRGIRVAPGEFLTVDTKKILGPPAKKDLSVKQAPASSLPGDTINVLDFMPKDGWFTGRMKSPVIIANDLETVYTINSTDEQFAFAGATLGRPLTISSNDKKNTTRFKTVEIWVPSDLKQYFEIEFKGDGREVAARIKVNSQDDGDLSADKKWKRLLYALSADEPDSGKSIDVSVIAISVPDPAFNPNAPTGRIKFNAFRMHTADLRTVKATKAEGPRKSADTDKKAEKPKEEESPAPEKKTETKKPAKKMTFQELNALYEKAALSGKPRQVADFIENHLADRVINQGDLSGFAPHYTNTKTGVKDDLGAGKHRDSAPRPLESMLDELKRARWIKLRSDLPRAESRSELKTSPAAFSASYRGENRIEFLNRAGAVAAVINLTELPSAEDYAFFLSNVLTDLGYGASSSSNLPKIRVEARSNTELRFTAVRAENRNESEVRDQFAHVDEPANIAAAVNSMMGSIQPNAGRAENRVTAGDVERGKKVFTGELKPTGVRGNVRPSTPEDFAKIDMRQWSARDNREQETAGILSLANGEVGFATAAAGASSRQSVAEAPASVIPAAEKIHGTGHVLESKAGVPIVTDEATGTPYSYLGLMLTDIELLLSQIGEAVPGSAVDKNRVIIMTNQAYQDELDNELRRNGFYGLSEDQFVHHAGEIGYQQDLAPKFYLNPEMVEKVYKGIVSKAKPEEKAELERQLKPLYEASLAKAKQVQEAIEAGRPEEVVHPSEIDPAGHAEFFHQMVSKGVLLDLIDRGIKYIPFRNIDNAAATFDAHFLSILGYMILHGLDAIFEVSRRGPGMKGGAWLRGENGSDRISEDPSIDATWQKTLKQLADAGWKRVVEKNEEGAEKIPQAEWDLLAARIQKGQTIAVEPSQLSFLAEQINTAEELAAFTRAAEPKKDSLLAVFKNDKGEYKFIKKVSSADTVAINNAVGIYTPKYIANIFQLPGQSFDDFVEEMRSAKARGEGSLDAIAERGRLKLPLLIDPKPSKDKSVIGLVKTEGNMHEVSGEVGPEIRVQAIGVASIRDFDMNVFNSLSADAKVDYLDQLVFRFLATKQWKGPAESYEANLAFYPLILTHILKGQRVDKTIAASLFLKNLTLPNALGVRLEAVNQMLLTGNALEAAGKLESILGVLTAPTANINVPPAAASALQNALRVLRAENRGLTAEQESALARVQENFGSTVARYIKMAMLYFAHSSSLGPVETDSKYVAEKYNEDWQQWETKYSSIKGNAGKIRLAKTASIKIMSLDGGLGEKLRRALWKAWLASVGLISSLAVKIGAKGTDMGRFDKLPDGRIVYVSVSERKLLQFYRQGKEGRFNELSFQAIVNGDSKGSYDELLEKPSLEDIKNGNPQPRTYRELLASVGVKVDEYLFQPKVPGLREIDDAQGNKIMIPAAEGEFMQEGGHAQIGDMIIGEPEKYVPRADGKPDFVAFTNGDNEISSEILPEIVGDMIQNNYLIGNLVTMATRVDRKGGKYIVRLMTFLGLQKWIPGQRELAAAQEKGPAATEDFYKAGQPEGKSIFGAGSVGNQPFNTNNFYINRGKLMPFLLDLKTAMGAEAYLAQVTSPNFMKKSRKTGKDGIGWYPVDGAIGNVFHNINEFVMLMRFVAAASAEKGIPLTDKQRQIIEVLDKHKVSEVIHYYDVASDYFTPQKNPVDALRQMVGKYYTSNPNTGNLAESQSGLVPPEFNIQDSEGWAQDSGQGYYSEFFNLLKTFVSFETPEDILNSKFDFRKLDKLEIFGNVAVREAVFEGNVKIVNQNKGADVFDLGAAIESNADLKAQLGIADGQPITLKNVTITISENGDINIRRSENRPNGDDLTGKLQAAVTVLEHNKKSAIEMVRNVVRENSGRKEQIIRWLKAQKELKPEPMHEDLDDLVNYAQGQNIAVIGGGAITTASILGRGHIIDAFYPAAKEDTTALLRKQSVYGLNELGENGSGVYTEDVYDLTKYGFHLSTLERLLKNREVILIDLPIRADMNYEKYENDLLGYAMELGKALRNIRNQGDISRKVFILSAMAGVDASQAFFDKVKYHAHPANGEDLNFDVVYKPDFSYRVDDPAPRFVEPYAVFGLRENLTEKQKSATKAIIESLYAPDRLNGTQLEFMNIRSAEQAKDALMIYLGTKYAMFNELSSVSQYFNADPNIIALGAGLDKRIRNLPMNPSIGFGGRLLMNLRWIKEIRLHQMKNKNDAQRILNDRVEKFLTAIEKDDFLQSPADSFSVSEMLLDEKHFPRELHLLFWLEVTLRMNQRALKQFQKRIEGNMERHAGGLRNKDVALIGVGYSRHLGQVTESPALELIDWLLDEKKVAKIVISDPEAQAAFEEWKEIHQRSDLDGKVFFPPPSSSVYDTIRDTAVTIIATDSNDELNHLDLPKFREAARGKIVFDGINLLGLRSDGTSQYTLKDFTGTDYTYVGVGRAKGLTDSTIYTPKNYPVTSFKQKVITIVGGGYVGLVTAAFFAKMGHRVHVVEIDPEKVRKLNLEDTEVPIYEPGLKEMINEGKAKGLITFSTDLGAAVKESSMVYLAVGTPQSKTGAIDLTYILDATKQIGEVIKNEGQPKDIIVKSTVTPDTFIQMDTLLETMGLKLGEQYSLGSNPEFLKEGTAIADVTVPDRTVIGTFPKMTQAARDRLANELLELFQPNLGANPGQVFVVTDTASSTLIKYAANAFLAVSISLANFIARDSEKKGASYKEVALVLKRDARIGRFAFLAPGCGYGGSCFPKDVLAVANESFMFPGYPIGIVLLADQSNDFFQIDSVRDAVKYISEFEQAPRPYQSLTVPLLGATFKGTTDDMRQAPSLAMLNELLRLGSAKVTVTDPIFTLPDAPERRLSIDSFYRRYFEVLQDRDKKYAGQTFDQFMAEFQTTQAARQEFADSPEAAAVPYKDSVKVIFIATDWPQYKEIDFGKMKLNPGTLIYDQRGVMTESQIQSALDAGLRYKRIGEALRQEQRSELKIPEQPLNNRALSTADFRQSIAFAQDLPGGLAAYVNDAQTSVSETAGGFWLLSAFQVPTRLLLSFYKMLFLSRSSAVKGESKVAAAIERHLDGGMQKDIFGGQPGMDPLHLVKVVDPEMVPAGVAVFLEKAQPNDLMTLVVNRVMSGDEAETFKKRFLGTYGLQARAAHLKIQGLRQGQDIQNAVINVVTADKEHRVGIVDDSQAFLQKFKGRVPMAVAGGRAPVQFLLIDGKNENTGILLSPMALRLQVSDEFKVRNVTVEIGRILNITSLTEQINLLVKTLAHIATQA